MMGARQQHDAAQSVRVDAAKPGDEAPGQERGALRRRAEHDGGLSGRKIKRGGFSYTRLEIEIAERCDQGYQNPKSNPPHCCSPWSIGSRGFCRAASHCAASCAAVAVLAKSAFNVHGRSFVSPPRLPSRQPTADSGCDFISNKGSGKCSFGKPCAPKCASFMGMLL